MERSHDRSRLRLLATAVLVVLAVVLLTLQGPAAVASVTGSVTGAVSRNASRVVNQLRGPPLVALQVGHLQAASHPEELAALRVSTGGEWGDTLEVDVNHQVALALADRLDARGIRVELLPATVPPGYRADAFLSLHADSSPDPTRRGYKSAIFRQARNRWDPVFKRHVDEAYLTLSGLPDDDANVSGDMLEYYAFNSRFRHSLHRGTPALIVELGYLSHPDDLLLLSRAEDVSSWLEQGIIAFLTAKGRLSP